MEPYIDAHCHVWTGDVGHYPLAGRFTVSDMKPRSFTAQELLETCRPSGVGRVNLIQMSYYEFPDRSLTGSPPGPAVNSRWWDRGTMAGGRSDSHRPFDYTLIRRGRAVLPTRGAWRAERSRPARHRQTGHPPKMGEVVGHQRRGQSQGVRGDQQVHGADRSAGFFQFVADASVISRAGCSVVIKHLEGREDFPDRGDLGVKVSALVAPNSNSETVMADRPTTSPFT